MINDELLSCIVDLEEIRSTEPDESETALYDDIADLVSIQSSEADGDNDDDIRSEITSSDEFWYPDNSYDLDTAFGLEGTGEDEVDETDQIVGDEEELPSDINLADM